MLPDTHESHHVNTEKAFSLAAALFPGEEWILYGQGIFVAKNRFRHKKSPGSE